ncbi:MAG: response regulator [Nostocoides sp.]
MSPRIAVLVVDDDRDSLLLFKHFFTGHTEYKPTLCRTPLEAKVELTRRSWDIVITDLQMPSLDGVELGTLAHAMYPDMPILLTTAFPTLDAAVRALRGSFTDFLVKPLRQEEVFAAIERALVRSILAGRHVATASPPTPTPYLPVTRIGPLPGLGRDRRVASSTWRCTVDCPIPHGLTGRGGNATAKVPHPS